MPALLRRYRDLSQIRHDYPLLLISGDAAECVKPLASVMNGILQDIAPRGIAGERLRRNVLELEAEMRRLMTGQAQAALSPLWEQAAANLLSAPDVAAADGNILQGNLERARRALACDGELVACSEHTPARFLTHVWNTIESEKARTVRGQLDELAVKLSAILKVDRAKSAEGRSAAALRAAIGPGFADAFDFQAMSDLLRRSGSTDSLPERRRDRIRAALSVLESQPFFPAAESGRTNDSAGETYSFACDSCTAALQAFRARRADMAQLIKAVRIAKLEIENQYRERLHEPFFERFDQHSLSREEIRLFPSYLVLLDDRTFGDADKAALIEILSSDLPIKVLFHTRDLFDDSCARNAQCVGSGWNAQLATMAASLNSAHVVQTTSSHLYPMADEIAAGLRYGGPALFSVYSGSGAGTANLAPYLVAAAALQSRAFPAFVYRPDAGGDWASRFSLAGNPQVEAAWPATEFSYEDEGLQAVSENIAFTFPDFVAADARFAACFAGVPCGDRSESMMPVNEYLELDEQRVGEGTPYILMVDGRDRLHRVRVGEPVIAAARRCAALWRNLQELGGINNSHAAALLAQEKAIWEQEKQRELAAIESRHAGEAAEIADLDATAAREEQRPEADEAPQETATSDEAYIETARCSSCNECVDLNKRMFAYNEDKQAYIKDIDAGTYHDLVEAAERCQLAIIHPGRPRNPDEVDLEDLIARAAAFP